ncbi:hypothetical protein B0T25DRAFT_574487 [Lasiosphaeria hispida]|uniref:Uncharacterized protein n=1 Tax=Lasiosphaeria hispida TaxID=260671 RepID=A0AAJ0H7V2_9PEZI|nr:hypothetical protein B0T25DRAFT_574487 [Lasiosphaeria hispida]
MESGAFGSSTRDDNVNLLTLAKIWSSHRIEDLRRSEDFGPHSLPNEATDLQTLKRWMVQERGNLSFASRHRAKTTTKAHDAPDNLDLAIIPVPLTQSPITDRPTNRRCCLLLTARLRPTVHSALHKTFYLRWIAALRRWLCRLLDRYVRVAHEPLLDTGYLLLGYIAPTRGQMLSQTWQKQQTDERLRLSLHRGISRLLLALTRLALPRIERICLVSFP